MARRVSNDYRSLSRQVHDALANTDKMTSTQADNYMRGKKIKPTTSSSELRKIVASKSKRSGIPIKVSKDMTKGHRNAEGVAIRFEKGVEVRIHPVARYSSKKHINDLIGHELDHARVDLRIQKRRMRS